MDDIHYKLVTCIILCYKKIECLYGAIDSALMQDYPRIELLIGDDGTDDFPQNDVEEYVASHKNKNVEKVVVYHNPTNLGTVKNINNMLKISSGDIFMTLSGDDVFYDNTVFSRIVDRIEKTGTDFLACARMRCSEELEPIEIVPNKKQLKHIRKFDTAEKQFKAFITFDFSEMASGSAMYYTRENLERMGSFDETYRLWEDGPRLTKYVQAGNMIPTAYDIVSIKYRDGGISTANYKISHAKTQLGEDHKKFIELMLIPNKKGTNLKRRRRYIFEYYWEKCKTKPQRMLLLLRYPEKGWKLCKKRLRRLFKR